MAWNQTDVDTLRTALVTVATSPQEVTYADGRRVKFNTVDQVAAALRVVEAQVQMEARASSGVIRRRLPYFRSGL